MAASLVSSRGPVSVMSWQRSRGQVVAHGLGQIRWRSLSDKLTGILLSGALLIAAIAAGRFDASEVGEVELDNGVERLGGRTAQQAFGKSRQPIGIGGL
jgi:hypothetical protein